MVNHQVTKTKLIIIRTGLTLPMKRDSDDEEKGKINFKKGDKRGQ